MHTWPQNFSRAGRVLASRRLAAGAGGHDRPAGVRPSLPPVSSSAPGLSPLLFRLFPGCFSIMASLAQALEIGPVDEPGPVPPVGLHMVHHRGPGADAPACALPAPWLPQELPGPQIVGPDGQAVPAVPFRRGPPGRWPGLVPVTVPLPGESGAPRVPAWSEGLHGHGLSPPGKTKSQSPTTSHAGIMSGSGFQSTGLCRCLPSRCACSCGSRRLSFAPPCPSPPGADVCGSRDRSTIRPLR